MTNNDKNKRVGKTGRKKYYGVEIQYFDILGKKEETEDKKK